MAEPVFSDRDAARLRPDVAGSLDVSGAGEIRVSGGTVAALIGKRRFWVALWVWYPESASWAKGVRSHVWWDAAKSCESPAEVPA